VRAAHQFDERRLIMQLRGPCLNRTVVTIGVAFLVFVDASRLAAEEGPIAGVDVGVAVPLNHFKDRVDTAGALSLMGGYMFNDFLGLTGQAEEIVGEGDKVRGIRNDDIVSQFAFTAGPRVELPLRDWSRPKSAGEMFPVLYLTGQPGVFTGTSGGATSGTHFGYTAGLGVNVRITDALLLGAFGRYNWVDEHVTGERFQRSNVSYVTTGLGLTYNVAPPPPVVAEAPPPAPAPPVQKKIVLRGVHFDFDKADIRSDARPVLDEAIATLKREGTILIVAEGHTDSKGTDAYNQALSERRAKAVRDYLVHGGIAANRIEVQGFGESRPVASNATEDGRAQNRRVELRIRGE
jgi:outer membrane protein OmpA-like peptidoglycan-associated protein